MKAQYSDRIQALSAPKPGTLVDLTERVRLLGDRPVHTGMLPCLFLRFRTDGVSGAYSEFWLGGTSSGNVVTVKLFRRRLGYNISEANVSKHIAKENRLLRRTNQAFILREAQIAARLSHPHLLPHYGVIHIDDRIGAVTPYMKLGNLMSYITSFPNLDTLHLVGLFREMPTLILH